MTPDPTPRLMAPAPVRRPVTSLLVANRGEIARRIMRTARTMGITTVAVHSDADADSPHVTEADLAVRLPGVSPSETYLRHDLLLDAADRTGADAVHPGYGFLSESGDFARRVIGAGLIWVGPSPEAIDAMGSKIGAKETMRAAGVPTLASITIDGDSPPEAADLDRLGWPLLVKASAGGGGRGMRIVAGPTDLADALAGARREALSAFGDGTVFLERYITSPRHIEVQILADAHGSTVALFERECSIQRRHQKIIEEAPSPVVGPELRARLSEAAVAAAQAVGYLNAGTVEFVLDTGAEDSNRYGAGDGEPYFLEMNTRLQVEHPVTEAVTGLDLVRLQLLIAGGSPMPEEVHQAVARGPVGHAVEARLYAEDPAAGWLPSTGDLHLFDIAHGRANVRVDSGVEVGGTVSPHYDPMLAKVIVHAPTRGETIACLAAALAEARIHGVTTNRDLLVRTLRHEAFGRGATDTGFLDRHGLALLAAPLADAGARGRHAVAAALAGQAERRTNARAVATVPSGWRNNTIDRQELSYTAGDRKIAVTYRMGRRGRALAAVALDGIELDVSATDVRSDGVSLTVDGVTSRYRVQRVGGVVFVDGPDGSSQLIEDERLPVAVDQVAAGSALAPMPGSVVRVAVSTGDQVEAGQVLVVLEAMKMEHSVNAGIAGTVTGVDVAEGDQVETGRVLAIVEAHADGAPDTGAEPEATS
jgi:propionyl-CoA carboxylase alpha chain